MPLLHKLMLPIGVALIAVGILVGLNQTWQVDSSQGLITGSFASFIGLAAAIVLGVIGIALLAAGWTGITVQRAAVRTINRCSQCGTFNSPDSKYCKACGGALVESTQTKQA